MLGEKRLSPVAFDSFALDLLAQFDEIVGRGNRDQQTAARFQHAGALGGIAPAVH